MRILILGATGNIAKLAAAALARRGDVRLRLTSSRNDGVELLRATCPQAEVMQADWYDLPSLHRALEGVNRVMVITPDFVTDETVVTPNIIAAARGNDDLDLLVRLIALSPGFEESELSEAWRATRTGAAQHAVAKPQLDVSGLPVTYVNAACWIGFNLPWYIAEDVKSSRRMLLPADAARSWLDEHDIADVFAKILIEGPADHAGREYLITGSQPYRFAELADMVGDEIGEKVTWVDSDEGIRRIFGDMAETLLTYLDHEKRYWNKIPITDTVLQLLGREPVSLRQYIAKNRNLFI